MKKLLLLFLILPGLLFSQADLLEDGYTQFLIKQFSLPANAAGYLLNDGSGGLSWGAIDLSAYWKINGTSTPSADWNMGAFGLTAKNYTAVETLGSNLVPDVSGFTHDGNFTYGTGAWTHSAAAYNVLTGDWTPTANTWYRVTFTITSVGGQWVFLMGGSVFRYTTATGAQSYDVYTTTTGAPMWGVYSGPDVAISSISIKAISNGTVTSHLVDTTAVWASDGTGDAPSIGFKNYPGTGIFTFGGYLEITSNGSNICTFDAAWQMLYGPLYLSDFTVSLSQKADYVLRLGTDAASPVAQTIVGASGLGSNKAGASLTIAGGQGTGSGAGGSVIIATAPAGGSSSTENALVNRVITDSAGLTTFTLSTGANTAKFINHSYGLGGTSPVIIDDGGGSTLGLGWGIGTTSHIANEGTVGLQFFFGAQRELSIGNSFHSGLTGDSDLVLILPKSITVGEVTGLLVNSTGNLNRLVYKVTVDYTGFSAAALTADHTIATLPAKTKIVGFYADTTVPFTGGGVTAAALTVGKSAGGVEYIATHDVLSAAIVRGLADADMGTELTRAAAIQGGAVMNWTATTPVSARLTTTTANTDQLTAGSTTFYIVTERY